jgi:hypothetical protein
MLANLLLWLILAVLSGERWGLDQLLDEEEALIWGRTLGSIQSLLPRNKEGLHFIDPKLEFIFMRNSDRVYEPISMEESLRRTSCERILADLENIYGKDPHYGGPPNDETFTKPPPVKR